MHIKIQNCKSEKKKKKEIPEEQVTSLPQDKRVMQTPNNTMNLLFPLLQNNRT